MNRGVCVVTGASAGVGRALARLLAAQGWDLGLIARGRDGLEAARAEAEAAGVRALAVSADVASADDVEAAAAAVEAVLGPIDCWVNNAMVSVLSPVHECSADEIRRVTEVTYLGTVHGTLAALRRMRPRNRGVIVQVGSALAYRGIPLQAAYCGAKHAVQGFTESLRCELLHDGSGVRVSMVQLPALNTPQFTWVRSRLPRHPRPVPPIFEPELAAEAILWAMTHSCREVNVGGRCAQAIVANNVFPSWLDRKLARSGYAAQQAEWPVEPARQDNLFAPVPGDHGARGPFRGAKSGSLQWRWASRRRWLAPVAAVAAGLAWTRARRRHG